MALVPASVSIEADPKYKGCFGEISCELLKWIDVMHHHCTNVHVGRPVGGSVSQYLYITTSWWLTNNHYFHVQKWKESFPVYLWLVLCAVQFACTKGILSFLYCHSWSSIVVNTDHRIRDHKNTWMVRTTDPNRQHSSVDLEIPDWQPEISKTMARHCDTKHHNARKRFLQGLYNVLVCKDRECSENTPTE